MTHPARPDRDAVIAHTRAWLARVVIGLNLCPFARGVHAHDQIRWVVCDDTDEVSLLALLLDELDLLARADPAVTATTLLIHPHVLADFGDYNQFLGEAETALERAGFEGTLQLASFHPHYRFAGTRADDVVNATNRSPYPMLHLLREISIERAVAEFPDPATIYENNIRTLQALGTAGWRSLMQQCSADAANATQGPSPSSASRRR